MQPLLFDMARQHPFRILCLGAHCDDIEIGCGATILRLARSIPDLEVRWVVFTGNAARQAEARGSAAAFLDGVARATVETQGFRESFLPQQWGAVKEEFERIKAGFTPSLIFTHCRSDAHQDHRLVSELTWNTFRDHLVLEYEIPKYDGDLGNPNLFIPVSRADADHKAELILSHFPSQHGRAWFGADTFLGLMRIRGIGCNAASGMAEGFHARKLSV